MTQDVFKKKWEKGLTEYLRKLDPTRVFGFTRCHKNGEPAKHGYIIELRDGESDIDVISRFNVLAGQDDFEMLIGKPHPLARHLNSSQVMCYNFFRPMMTVTAPQSRLGYANEELVRFVKETIGINISEKALCQFEHEDSKTKQTFKEFAKYKGKGEDSQFDFFIHDGEIKIYFEIKYTEDSFGGWTKNKKTSQNSIANHCAYIEKGYKDLLKKSCFFTDDCKHVILSCSEEAFSNPNNSFNNHYQLFRNALKADEDTYSVFIFPNANLGPQEEFEAFKRNLVESQNHIIALRWEDLTSYMSPEFIEKYIKILE